VIAFNPLSATPEFLLKAASGADPMPPSSSTTGIAGHCTRAATARAAAPTRADDLPPYIALEVVRRCSMLAQLAGTHSRSVIESFGLRGRGAVVPLPAIRSQKPAYGESTDAARTIAFPRRLLRPELMGRQVATPSLLWAGRVNWKLAPRGTVAAAHTRPPWASMIERQIDSPIPIPPGLVV
jgi:hypothetical protein